MKYLLFFVLSFFCLNGLQARSSADAVQDKDLVGTALPDATFYDVEGKVVKLSSLKGKYLFIDIWATWCPPCCGELPHLAELEKRFEGKNIHFVSISVDSDLNAWKKKVKEDKLGGIQLTWAKSDDFMRFFNVRGIPRFILVDREGKILKPEMTRPSQEITAKSLEELPGI